MPNAARMQPQMMLELRAFGEYLEHLRLRAGMKQHELIDRLRDGPYKIKNVGIRDLNDYKNGRRMPNMTYAQALVEAVGGSPEQLSELLAYCARRAAALEAASETDTMELAMGDVIQFATRLAEGVLAEKRVAQMLDRTAAGIAPEQHQQALAILKELQEHPEKAKQFLDFGRDLTDRTGQ